MAEPQMPSSLESRLRDFLESLDYSDKETRVEEVSPTNVIGVLTTPDFNGMDESERQEQVWAAIHDEFTPTEQARIEFIFTNTPDEERKMDENGD